MSLPQRKNEHYTYTDYCAWDDGKRWELIDGVAFEMQSAPSTLHQEVLIELAYQLKVFLKGKPCRLFPAPFDVRLNADDGDDTVVQPDLAVICDDSKIDEKGCKGAPDFIIEIISPSSARHDRWTKYNLYRNTGVKEYWIVDPTAKTVTVNILGGDGYIEKTYGGANAVNVGVLPGCQINLQDIFAV